jgi:hypothetical protein
LLASYAGMKLLVTASAEVSGEHLGKELPERIDEFGSSRRSWEWPWAAKCLNEKMTRKGDGAGTGAAKATEGSETNEA